MHMCIFGLVAHLKIVGPSNSQWHLQNKTSRLLTLLLKFINDHGDVIFGFIKEYHIIRRGPLPSVVLPFLSSSCGIADTRERSPSSLLVVEREREREVNTMEKAEALEVEKAEKSNPTQAKKYGGLKTMPYIIGIHSSQSQSLCCWFYAHPWKLGESTRTQLSLTFFFSSG